MTRVPPGRRFRVAVDFNGTVACELNGGCVKLLSQKLGSCWQVASTSRGGHGGSLFHEPGKNKIGVR